MQPYPDDSEWQVANQQRLAAIELQREKVQGLERKARQRQHDELDLQTGSAQRVVNEPQQPILNSSADTLLLSLTGRVWMRNSEQVARDRETQRRHDEAFIKRIEQRRFDERREPASSNSSNETILEQYPTQYMDQQNGDRNQHKHKEASIMQTEQREVNEHVEPAWTDNSRLDSRQEQIVLEVSAKTARDWELWRLEDRARRLKEREQRLSRDYEGRHKRPPATQQSPRPSAEKGPVPIQQHGGPGARARPVAIHQPAGPRARVRLAGDRDRRSRYSFLL